MYKGFLNAFIDRDLNYGRRHIARFLSDAKDTRTVLDIGAGHGTDLMSARRINGDAELHAVEVYDEYVAELRRQNITVHQLNVERDRLPFDDESVDVIIANQVLEHVKELFYVFHEVSRTLKANGRFIIGVPNLASLHNRALLMIGRQPSCIQNDSAHVRGYTRSDLVQFVESCFPGGYTLTAFKGSNFYPFPPFLANPLSWLFPNMAWGIFLCLEKQKPYTRQFIDFPVNNKLETNFYTG